MITQLLFASAQFTNHRDERGGLSGGAKIALGKVRFKDDIGDPPVVEDHERW